MLRHWAGCGCLGTSSPLESPCCTGQEEAGGALVFTLERAQCLAPALLLLGGNTSFSHPTHCLPNRLRASSCLTARGSDGREGGTCPKEGPNSGSPPPPPPLAGREVGPLFCFYCLGFFLPPLKRPRRWHWAARHGGAYPHTCEPSTQEAEAGDWRVHGQPGLHSNPAETVSELGVVEGSLLSLCQQVQGFSPC